MKLINKKMEFPFPKIACENNILKKLTNGCKLVANILVADGKLVKHYESDELDAYLFKLGWKLAIFKATRPEHHVCNYF